jgi:hypothetical protein
MSIITYFCIHYNILLQMRIIILLSIISIYLCYIIPTHAQNVEHIDNHYIHCNPCQLNNECGRGIQHCIYDIHGQHGRVLGQQHFTRQCTIIPVPKTTSICGSNFNGKLYTQTTEYTIDENGNCSEQDDIVITTSSVCDAIWLQKSICQPDINGMLVQCILQTCQHTSEWYPQLGDCESSITCSTIPCHVSTNIIISAT